MPNPAAAKPSRKPGARLAEPKSVAPRPVAGALADYAGKRVFAATPEPMAALPKARAGPLLFVVQQHSARQLHYDLRLELDGVLKSWAIPKGPSLDPGVKRLAVLTEDHPFDYASFEGVIPPKQYGAGEVIVWDCGVYAPDEDHRDGFHDREEAERQVRAALEKGKLSFFLRGEKLKGSFALVRSADPKNWLLIKHRDAFAGQQEMSEPDRSVISGMTVADLRHTPAPEPLPAARLVPSGSSEAMPARLSPMLAELAEAPFTHPNWMFEPKLDGYRILAFVREGEVKLRSRRGLDLTRAFPQIAGELARQSTSGMILDGEVLAFDAAGRPSFNALQNRAQLKAPRDIAAAERDTPAMFYCFDLLHFAGLDLRQAPYSDRRRYLAQCLLPSGHVQLVHASADGAALYTAALAQGFEGVVAKRRDSRYEAGRRSPAWLKIKPTQSAEFVIGGYTRGQGARAPLGALLLGYWEAGQLRYAGHVGSGFDDATLDQLKRRLAPLETGQRPFAEPPPLHRTTVWLRPETVAEVKFAEWTRDGVLRAPVFLWLREDVEPRRVLRERQRSATPGDTWAGEVVQQLADPRQAFTLAVGPHRVRLTHLDRVYWPADRALRQPALTKRDLLRYLAQVSPHMLPHLADRPLTMIRMPEGIRGERFYQKHWEPALPEFAESVTIFSESRDERHDYLLCNNLPTLLWLAQSGTLEFHVWHSRARPAADAASDGTDYASSAAALERSVLNYPDYLVFDLDPYIYSGKESAGAEPEYSVGAWEKGRETAFRLRELLQAMGLEPLVKTSGKTGLHVFVPIERTLDFAAVREVSGLVGRHLLRQHPKLITMDWTIAKRTGKIFFDYTMNTRGKTLAAAYSPRGLPGAPVSMPLTWDELPTAQPPDFSLSNVAQRLAQTGDPWRDALTRKHSLERTLARTKPP